MLIFRGRFCSNINDNIALFWQRYLFFFLGSKICENAIFCFANLERNLELHLCDAHL